MIQKQRNVALRLSEQIDELMAGGSAETTSEDGTSGHGDIQDLVELAGELSRLKILPPSGLEDEIARRLSYSAQNAALGSDGGRQGAIGWQRRRLLKRATCWFRHAPTALGTAVAVVILCVALGIGAFTFLSGPKASAADILSHCRSVLTKLAGSGKILYRRWDVVYITTEPNQEPQRRDQVVHEWMDGSNPERTAARSYDPNGRLVWAYVSIAEGNDLRPYIYQSSNSLGDPDPVLNVEPTRSELREALDHFSAGERELLKTYLERSYIYHPIAGDQKFNRAALLAPSPGSSRMPRSVASVDTAVIKGGERAYRVRILEPLQVRLSWRSREARLGRVETVRYISQESYLSLRAEEQVAYEDGRRVSMTWDMAETRILDRVEEGLEDPFALVRTEGTEVRRHSAIEVLTSYARALRKAARTSPSSPE